MRDKVTILTRFNDNFQVHGKNLVLRLQVFKQRMEQLLWRQPCLAAKALAFANMTRCSSFRKSSNSTFASGKRPDSFSLAIKVQTRWRASSDALKFANDCAGICSTKKSRNSSLTFMLTPSQEGSGSTSAENNQGERI